MKFFSFFFFISLILLTNLEANPVKVLNKRILEYSKILDLTNQLKLSGMGGGAPKGKINVVMANYTCIKTPQLKEARTDIVKLTEFYLYKITHDPDLIPLLENPFALNNLRLGIGYDKPNGDCSSPVAFVFTRDGFVFYSEYDFEKGQLERIHKETFEEASRIVNGEKNTPPPENASPSP